MKTTLTLLFCCALTGCSTLASQQQAIRSEVRSPNLRPLYSTDLYSVYYDSAVNRCVLHAYVHTAGSSGTGDGVGVSSFECNPDQVSARVKK
jgi:hypothetical protein